MNKSKIIVFLLVALAVGFWIASFFYKGAPKSKASGETMTLTFNPATQTAAADADFTVSLLAKPSLDTVLRGYKVKVNFDKTALKLKTIQYKVGVVSAGLGNVTEDVAKINTDGFFDLIGEDTTAIGSTLTTATGAELASLTFTAITATGSSVLTSDQDFNSVNSDKTLFNTWTYVPAKLDVNGGGSTGGTCTSFTDDFSGTTVNSANFGLWTDNNGTMSFADGKVTLQLPASTDGKEKMVDLDAYIRKSKSDLSFEITSSSISGENTGKAFLAIWATEPGDKNSGFGIERATGGEIRSYVHIYQQANTNESQVVQLATPLTNNEPVKFKAERIGSTINLYYDLMKGQGYQLARTVDNFPNLELRAFFGLQNFGTTFPQVTGIFDNFSQTCASTGGTTGNVNLKIKAKFQGIIKQPAAAQNSMNVKVKVYSEGVATPYEGTGAFTADEKGIWSGTIGVNIPSITGKYKIMLKGPQHLQKKVCESTPTETSPGVYRCATGNITLVAGDNNLDFSGIIFLVGDLDQNGIVDSVDFGMVKNCLGKSDAACVASSDLNRDGTVNTQDFSLIIFALGVRTDEL